MTTADHVDLSICQFVEAWRVFCDAAPSPAWAAADGLTCAFSRVPVVS